MAKRAKETSAGLEGSLLQANIKFIRNHKKLTYKEFASEINVSEGQAKTYELRAVTPPLSVLCAIADFASVSVDALIRERITESIMTQLREPLINFEKSYQLQVRLGFIIKMMLRERAFGKYTNTEMQKALHLSEGQYKKMLAGDGINISIDTMVAFIEVFNVNANWWLTGNGPKFNDTELVQGYQKLNARLKKLEGGRS